MKYLHLFFVGLMLAACTKIPAADTDPIAGYWSGKVDVLGNSENEILLKNVGILIITDCPVGKVCGKFSEDGLCPGDIILTEVNGNKFTFLYETVGGTRNSCGSSATRRIVLELLPDGTIQFDLTNGITLTGTMIKQ